MWRRLAPALALATTATTARAGAFYVPEIGGRATATGAAVVADGDDASAIIHDPANLIAPSDPSPLAIEVAADLVLPRVTFFRRPLVDPNTGQNLHFPGVDNSNHLIAVPFAGARYRLDARTAIGLAIYTPFGATLDFPADGPQRQVVTHEALRTIVASPGIARALTDTLSIGATANLIYGDLALDQRNALPYVTGDPEQYPDPQGELQGTTSLKGRDPFSLGATLGVAWRTRDDRLRVGASVMTPVTLHLRGDARVANPNIAALTDDSGREIQPAGVRTDQIHVNLPLPLVARLGVAAKLGARARVEFDVNWTRWSTSKELVVDFQHEYTLLPTPGAYLYDVHTAEHWRDTTTVRLGGELAVTPAVLARAGLVYDQSPIDDRHFSVLVPDSDKLGVTAGAAWRLPSGLELQLAGAQLFVRERDVEPTASGAPGSDGTILNKPAPSFFHGVTRAGFTIVTLAVGWRH